MGPSPRSVGKDIKKKKKKNMYGVYLRAKQNIPMCHRASLINTCKAGMGVLSTNDQIILA